MVVLKFASYFKFILNLFLTFRDGNNFVTFSVKSIVNTNVRNEIELPEKRNTEESEKKSQNMVMVLYSATCVLLLTISFFFIEFFQDYKRIVFPAQYKGFYKSEDGHI